MSRVDDDGHEHDLVMPGFRFHPTEEELIDFYLRRKVEGRRFNVEFIAFLDLYRYDPWELPALAAVGEKEWFFYVPRDRKYRNGDRPNRVTKSGYWKATGAGRAVRAEGSGSSSSIGVKKTLVFYSGKAPRGIRTSWIMNEYRLPQSEVERNHKADISLCRVYNRAGVEDGQQLPSMVPYKHGSSTRSGAAPGKRLHSSNSHQRKPAGFQSIIVNFDDASSSPLLDELQIRAETNTPTSSSSVVIPVPAALYRSTTSTTSLSPATSTDQEDISTPLLHQSKNTTASCLNSGNASSVVGAGPAFDELCRLVNLNQMSCMSQQPNHYLIQMPSSVQPQQLLQLDAVSDVPVLSAISDEHWEWNSQLP